MSNYLSDVYFHFVGRRAPVDHAVNYATLTKVLTSGVVKVSPADLKASSLKFDPKGRLENERLVVVSQTCFAEIRPEHLGIHVAKYGHFGIGFGRELMTKFGARPVFYVPTYSTDWNSIDGRTALRDIEAVYRGFLEHVVEPRNFPPTTSRTMSKIPADADEAIHAMDGIFQRYFLSYIKPFQCDLPHDDERYFYSEREWRSPIDVRFSANDIRYVVVHKDYYGQFVSDHPDLANRCCASDQLAANLSTQ